MYAVVCNILIPLADDEISKLEEDVKESYGALPDYASLAPPEVVPEVTYPSSASSWANLRCSLGIGVKILPQPCSRNSRSYDV